MIFTSMKINKEELALSDQQMPCLFKCFKKTELDLNHHQMTKPIIIYKLKGKLSDTTKKYFWMMKSNKQNLLLQIINGAFQNRYQGIFKTYGIKSHKIVNT